jgi:segregation and condensation protein B
VTALFRREPIHMPELTRILEALLFVSPRPVAVADMARAAEADEATVVEALDALAGAYASGMRGLELVEIAGGFTFRVADACAPAVERFAGARRPDDLSPALVETLSVVAYLQPTTRAEVAQVRGVSSEWALTSLVERGLVEERGRADAPGAPILYGTSERFLTLFGLRSLDDLPDLAGFALSASETEELRTRLLANAERRRT